jgi:hypothetical protein
VVWAANLPKCHRIPFEATSIFNEPCFVLVKPSGIRLYKFWQTFFF